MNMVNIRGMEKTQRSLMEGDNGHDTTNFNKKQAGMSADQKALYELIYARTTASQMADAKMKRTKVLANVTGTKSEIPDFSVNGSRVIFDGWLKADPHARGEDTEVPKVDEGDIFKCSSVDVEAKGAGSWLKMLVSNIRDAGSLAEQNQHL